MSDAEYPKKVAQDVDEELTRVVKSLLLPQQPKGQRRFRFAIGLLCLAPFCMTVAIFPWPSATLVDKLMWVGYALILLFVGAWQLDKSNKEIKAEDQCGEPQSFKSEGTKRNVLLLRKKKQ